MKTLLLVLLASSAWADLPPLIDRSLFFDNPEVAGAQLSPDGKYLAFIKPLDKIMNVWVKKIDEPFSSAKAVTDDRKRPIFQYFWSRDGKYILFVQDNAGDENFNVFAVNPADSPKAGERVPPARNITDAKKARAALYKVSKLDPDVIFVGLNDRDPAWHDVYKVRISTGERTLLRKNTDKISGWSFDLKDQLRIAGRVADNGDQELLRVDGDKFTKIYSCTVFEACQDLRFHKDGKRTYLESNGGNADLTSLQLLDVETGKTEPVESDPLKRVDLGQALFSDLTDELIATAYVDEKRRIYWRDKALEADIKALEMKFPGKQVTRTSVTRDQSIWLVSVSADVEPGETYIYVPKTKKLELQYKIREKLPRASLAEMKPVQYKSSDGLEIPAYLTLPKGVPAKNLPVIMFPHGGPWARDMWGYNTFHQFYANRGYAVLSMNFRGSTGYGKKFLNAGNNEWGQKMQDDITWGVKYLVEQGIADPKKVAITGGSYGGYATLAGVAFTPDVYAAAVSIVGPSNLKTLLDSIPPYWEAGRVMFYKRMGDMRTDEGKKQMERQSPLFAAAKIKTPLMVVQGANDPRVKQAESDQIVIALRDRNFPVKYLVAPDEGHGFAKPLNNLAMIVATERFFQQFLGGRSQPDVPEDVAKKLDELTVDPKKVTLAKKVDVSQSNAPKPSRPLTAGTYEYNALIEAGSNKVTLGLTTVIKEDAESWTVEDRMATPGGEAIDSAVLDKQTLSLRKRTIKQGPVDIQVAATDDKLTGTFKMNGNEKTIDAPLTGPLFAEVAAGFAIGALPLAEGYETAFLNYDMMRMKPKAVSARVAGIEKVSVPGGSFESFKVEVKPEDGGGVTYWIDKSTRKMVKMAATMPQMGGATITAELK